MPKKCDTHFSDAEREPLSLGLAQGQPLRQLARLLGRAPSTLSREVHRNTIRGHPYRACTDQTQAARRACQARRPRSRGTDRRGQLSNMTSIADRPIDVANRTVPGHWEGDRLKGARNRSAVWTLVERTTRLVILARRDGTDASSACEGFTKKLRHVPAPLRKTLTDDRGKEMAEHERLAHRLAIQIYFADPHAPWQRGTNENTNGLLRQYLPKGTDLSGYTQRELNAMAHRLNTRPRKCLNCATPLEVFTQLRHDSPVVLGT